MFNRFIFTCYFLFLFFFSLSLFFLGFRGKWKRRCSTAIDDDWFKKSKRQHRRWALFQFNCLIFVVVVAVAVVAVVSSILRLFFKNPIGFLWDLGNWRNWFELNWIRIVFKFLPLLEEGRRKILFLSVFLSVFLCVFRPSFPFLSFYHGHLLFLLLLLLPFSFSSSSSSSGSFLYSETMFSARSGENSSSSSSSSLPSSFPFLTSVFNTHTQTQTHAPSGRALNYMLGRSNSRDLGAIRHRIEMKQ